MELAPSELAVAMFWMVHELRAGNAGAACDLGARIATAKDIGDHEGMLSLVQAECATALGRDTEAIAAYARARSALGHAGIAHTLSEIHPKAPQPITHRMTLLDKLRAGALDHPGELLVLDATGTESRWNSPLMGWAIKGDLELLRAQLSPQDPRLLEYEIYGDWRLGLAGLDGGIRAGESANDADAQLLRALTEHGLFTPEGRLPHDPYITPNLLRGGISAGLLTEQQAVSRWVQPLIARSRGPEGSVEDLKTAAYLLTVTGDSGLAAVDTEGWERFSDPQFAVSVLQSLTDLSSTHPDFLRVKASFPRDPSFVSLEVSVEFEASSHNRDTLVRAILVEMRTQRVSQAANMFPYQALGYFFDALGKLSE